MKSIDKALRSMEGLDELRQRSLWVNRLHPLAKLLSAIIYIFITVSFDKYEIVPLAVMGIYPLFVMTAGELSLRDGLYRMRVVLPLLLAVGIFNPILDRSAAFAIGNFVVTGGMISFIGLLIKGFYTVLGIYILIATTGVDEICYALQCLHLPRILIEVVLLISRYFYTMGEEADRIITAYMLRAPRQRGIRYNAWGPLVGQWLLRSMDRARVVYESMCLRGFTGEFRLSRGDGIRASDIAYPLAWSVIFIIIRFTDVLELIGGIFIR